MPFELNIRYQYSFPKPMRLSGVLSSKFFYFCAPQRSLIVRSSSSSLPKGQFHTYIGQKSLNVKETNFEQICARFPCIKIGNSPAIQLYEKGKVETLEKYETIEIFKKSEKFEKVDKIPEPWQSLKSAISSPVIKEALSKEMESPVLKKTTSFKMESPVKEETATLKKETPVLEKNASLKMETPVTKERIEEKRKIIFQKPLFEIRAPWENILDQSVKFLPGIGKVKTQQLEDSELHTVRKLLNHFPKTYVHQQSAQGPIEDGLYFMSVGEVVSSQGIPTSQIGIHEVIVRVENSDSNKMIYLHMKKFFKGIRFTSYYFLQKMASKYRKGELVHVSGLVKKLPAENHYEIKEHSIDKLQNGEQEDYAQLERKPYPVYPSKLGLKPESISDAISKALKIISYAIDPMPSEILEEFNLLNLYDAYVGMHSPTTINDADLARRRFLFDDFFYLQLGKLFQMLEALGTNIEREELLDKYRNDEVIKVNLEEWAPLTRKLMESLPYTLTPSQLKAVSEIILDLKRPVPMNRLLQGDVGCGKTIVTFLACMEVIASGFQAAFMVPTELLAIQHYEQLNSLIDNLDLGENNGSKPKIAILTGSTSTRESRLILKELQSGEISMVIGTHSLFSERVEFCDLRIAVVDEQHRFGVNQRGRFNSKLLSRLRDGSTNLDAGSDEEKQYMAPHILAMSATPIPRSLALALYGDTSLTQITGLPPGRQPIETIVIEGNETGFQKVSEMMFEELSIGGKVYMVFPIIEESVQLPNLHAAAADYESICEKFSQYNCGLLHGRMKADEKEEALRKFREGSTQVLCATQVIEIGVDVPDASMMVVVNAERFGIAQLHQLRGRVGRGARKSRCVFLPSTKSALGRFKVLKKSSDGFYLANADLLIRGPGNLLGKRQSGHLPEFPVARLEIDGNILQEAHHAALKVLGTSNDLAKFPGLKAELSIRQPLCILGD